MSHVAERQLVDDATAWVAAADGFSGDTVTAPVLVKCRWIDRNEEFLDPRTGAQEVSRAVVYVDRTFKIGDWIYHGTSAVAHPKDLEGAYKIRRFDNTPNLRNLKMIRKAFL